ncbi:hypothetical protein GALMADRAFT_933111 [Galerina marginata CBS 339.88]|uniref:Uncharacterized protein n=1 Tax=Galerina marginata (strain CBS 339.88) TaxID=685588 RepID=A0A067SGA7_GALM3|nr:hypothetical protein GALMADRAFT_933111 [Galerina marginata CBS 339.88]
METICFDVHRACPLPYSSLPCCILVCHYTPPPPLFIFVMQRVWSTYLAANGHQIERPDSPHLMDPNSPRSSVISHANSAYSQAGSTRHILADMNNSSSSDYGGLLNPPSAPFARGPNGSSLSVASVSGAASNLSLSVNYLPSKFSSFSPVGARQRKGKGTDEPNLPKRGGGLRAFKTNEARMPQGKGRLKWNKFK